MSVEFAELASGLQFPEGPVWIEDNSVLLVEMARQTITRISSDGKKSIVAETPGGPNGLAMGPNGSLYVCNNGGMVRFRGGNPIGFERFHIKDKPRGRIEILLPSGRLETMYDSCDGEPLISPNDLVFDEDGGFWFTDFGLSLPDVIRRGAIYYAAANGSRIQKVVSSLVTANGIGLSPDGETVHISETYIGRLSSFPASSREDTTQEPNLTPLGVLPVLGNFDSLAVLANGDVCSGTVVHGGISVFRPRHGFVRHVPLPDPIVTNICFGGVDMRDAFVTLGTTGRLIKMRWPEPGLRLAFAY